MTTFSSDQGAAGRGNAVNDSGSQALPGNPMNYRLRLLGSRRSLGCSAFPGRAWERVYSAILDSKLFTALPCGVSAITGKPMNSASLEESVGENWFREGAEVVIESGFIGFLGAETVRFSGDQF